MTTTHEHLSVITPISSGLCVLVGDYLIETPRWISSPDEFTQQVPSATPSATVAVASYFENGGHQLIVVPAPRSNPNLTEALALQINGLTHFDFIVLDPTITWSPEWIEAAVALADRYDAVYLGSVPESDTDSAIRWLGRLPKIQEKHVVLYYPNIVTASISMGAQLVAAAIFSRLDQTKGVWASPAAANAKLYGDITPVVQVDNPTTIRLNNLGINCVRTFKSLGTVLWGNTSAVGLDHPNMYWKYIQIRRTLHYIKKNIVSALNWVRNRDAAPSLPHDVLGLVEPFLLDLYVQGAFYGKTPPECYQLSCNLEGDSLRLTVGIVVLNPDEFINQTLLIPTKKALV